MIQYVKEIIKNFPEEVGTSTAATLAAEHLFHVRKMEEAKLLQEEQAVNFHHTVAQSLVVSTRACRDLQTAVAFFITSWNHQMKMIGEN